MARKFRIQLMDHVTREFIQTSGGKCMVVINGGFDKVSLQDADGASASNPVSITNGLIEFWTATATTTVDIYGMAPGGQFFVATGVVAGSLAEIYIDSNQMHQVARIPFSHADSTAATEQDTGFDIPEDAVILPGGVGIHVGTVDATETIDFGILASEANGDADGFGDGLSVATAGRVAATLTNGSATLGVLLSVQDSANSGDLVPEGHVGDGTAESISYTLTTGTDTADGLLVIPYLIPAA